MKRVMLLGSSGQIGYELVRSLSPIAKVLPLGRRQLDLSGPLTSLEKMIQQLSPDIVINAAAYTAVDKAETEAKLAFQVNAVAPAVIAEICTRLQIPLIHFSTDYVFNGEAQSPWREDDNPEPINIYGQSKWQGELAIQESGVRHLIIRTSWVYGNRGDNFLNMMKRLAMERAQLDIVNDQVGSPTWSRHLADAVTHIVGMSFEGNDFWNKKTGVYHLTGGGQGTWYEFACAIFDVMRHAEVPTPKVNPIVSEAYPVQATRPKFSVLDNSRIKKRFGIELPNWKQSLSLVMQDEGFKFCD